MSGIYIHIPFCHQACIYCDFHFTISRQYQPWLCEALNKELVLRKNECADVGISSIYFGGGTPSLLEPDQLHTLFETMHRHYRIDPGAEITLEANPDDLTAEKLRVLKECGVNRLSIGIQSFRDDDLRFLNRSHDAQKALKCVEYAAQFGFEHFTIDLIYGIPGLSDAAWEENLRIAAALPVNHLSCYSLTLEQQTPYAKKVRKGLANAPDDIQSANQMEILMNLAPDLGFEQYEISNFARNGAYAVHNSAYWQNKPYLGIGPSAHSYDSHTRRQNLNNNQQYIRALNNGEDAPNLTETLSVQSAYNDLVLTGLRTIWGVESSKIEALDTTLLRLFISKISPWVKKGLAEKTSTGWMLNKKGWLLADRIAMDCFAYIPTIS